MKRNKEVNAVQISNNTENGVQSYGFKTQVKNSITSDNIVDVILAIGGCLIVCVNSIQKHGYRLSVTKGDTTVAFEPSTTQVVPS